MINGEGDVNGLQWSYTLYGEGEKTTESGRYGKFQSNWQTGRGQKGTPIILKEDEEIIAIEAGIDLQSAGIIKQIAFVTNRKRWPGDKGYYGRNRVDHYKTIKAPRVRGLYGSAENLIYSVGLNYLGLGARRGLPRVSAGNGALSVSRLRLRRRRVAPFCQDRGSPHGADPKCPSNLRVAVPRASRVLVQRIASEAPGATSSRRLGRISI